MIISIPRTGTHLLHHLLKMDYKHIGEGAIPHDDMVIPLRHPYIVAESWKRRGPYDLQDLYNRLEILITEFDSFNPQYVAIDTPQRYQQLRAIKKIRTDWPIINSLAGTWRLKRQKITPEPLMKEIVEKYADFWGRFYV